MNPDIAQSYEPTLSPTDRAVVLELEVLADRLRSLHHYIAAGILLDRVAVIREG